MRDIGVCALARACMEYCFKLLRKVDVMFEFLSLSRPATGSRKRRGVSLKLELLELRDCPAGITLDAVVQQGHMVELSGHVDGPNAAGAIVLFSGAVATLTIADSEGNYSITTTDAVLGNVYASAWYNGSPFTDTAYDQIDVAAPTINLGVLDM